MVGTRGWRERERESLWNLLILVRSHELWIFLSNFLGFSHRDRCVLWMWLSFLSTLQSFSFQMVLISLAPLILWEFSTLVFPCYMHSLCEQNLIDICVCIMFYYATLLVVIDSVGHCSCNAQPLWYSFRKSA